MKDKRPADSYRSFVDLLKFATEGVDFRIISESRPGEVAVIAIHGGLIEGGTSTVARSIARDDMSLYLFEGMRPKDNYGTLHLSSEYFDEPRCVDLISTIPYVISIHGFSSDAERVLVGGLDDTSKQIIAEAFKQAGVQVDLEGHAFPGRHPSNICNRGMRKAGIQLEVSAALRKSDDGALLVANVVRTAALTFA